MHSQAGYAQAPLRDHALAWGAEGLAGAPMPMEYLEPINDRNHREQQVSQAIKENRLEYSWFRAKYPPLRFAKDGSPIGDNVTDCHTPRINFVKAKGGDGSVFPHPPDDMSRRNDTLPAFDLEGLGDYSQDLFNHKQEIAYSTGWSYGNG
ncbi:hypothetical protein CYMTET_47978 [Cymbomonas tetramitiformis]|uniref:Uncharacterized protein n=1 Tax=Cymbomonas tetramitiformis TaxID=36881 RepID=A0AAE0BV18_9CHLO|nr:hypothetical protein CYMTET_47978 [Cymbomonas tetramitiformis]